MIHTFPSASGTKRNATCDFPECRVKSPDVRLGSGRTVTSLLKESGWQLTNYQGRYSQFCPEHARPTVGYEPLRTTSPSPVARRDDIAPGAAQHHPATGEGTTPRREFRRWDS